MPELKNIANITLELDGTDLKMGTDDHKIERKGHLKHESAYPHYEGVATGGTYSTIIDTLSFWQADVHIGRTVMITKADGSDRSYGIIIDNTASTLILESNLDFVAEAGDSYVIMDTLTLIDDDLSLMLVVDTLDYPMGVVLPVASADNTGYYIDAYMEAGDNPCVFLHTGIGRESYIALEHAEEGIRLIPSMNASAHWKLVLSQGVKRIGEGYWSAQEAVSSASFVPIGAGLMIDLKKRFTDVVVEGIHWMKYTSIMTTDFLAVCIGNIYKVGPGDGDMDLTIAYKDVDTGVITYKDNRYSSSKFGSGEGEQTVIVEVPLVLKRGDMIASAARKSDGTIYINPGSTLRIMEA